MSPHSAQTISAHFDSSRGNGGNPVLLAIQAVARFLGISPRVDVAGAQAAALRACVEATPRFDPRTEGAQGFFFRIAFEAAARHLSAESPRSKGR
jgi:hypothetical protein